MQRNRNLGPYFDGIYYGNRRVYQIISCLLIVSLLSAVLDFCQQRGINTWGCTEFLINYQGGFVRRGLVGEILFQISRTLHVSPVWAIYSICILSFLFVWAFFLKKFKDEGYSWWYLCSPLVLGYSIAIIRKDFLEYSLLIGIVMLLRHQSPSMSRRILATLMAVFGIFFHEAFIFYGGAVFTLLMLRCKGKVYFVNGIMIAPVVFAFLMQSYYKGNMEVAQSIVASWNSVLGPDTMTIDHPNSIAALGWETLSTFIFHIKKNFFNGTHGLGVVWQPIWLLAIYYFCTNFPFLFCRKDIADRPTKKLALSSLYLFVLICLLPMFLVLSCDYGRLYQYASVSALTVFVLVPHDRIMGLFPKWYVRLVDWINCKFEYILPPTRKIMVIMLLLLAMTPFYFDITGNFSNDVIGKDARLIFKSLVFISKKLYFMFLHP